MATNLTYDSTSTPFKPQLQHSSGQNQETSVTSIKISKLIESMILHNIILSCVYFFSLYMAKILGEPLNRNMNLNPNPSQVKVNVNVARMRNEPRHKE